MGRTQTRAGILHAALARLKLELVLFALLAIFLGVAYFQRTDADRDLVFERYRLPDSYATPVLSIRNNRNMEKVGVAVLVHGFQCNKSMMAALGKSLAARGVDVYAIDLPGHGESRVRFTLENGYAAARQAVAEVMRLAQVSDRQVVLIGHSYGSTVLGPVALGRPQIAASIYVGPGPVEHLSPDHPRNVLIVTAEHDYAHVKTYAQKSFDDLTGHRRSEPGATLYGDISTGTARAWMQVPGVAHVNMLTSDDVSRWAVGWTEQALGAKRSSGGVFSPAPAAYIVFIILGMSIVAVSLVAKLVPTSTRGEEALAFSGSWARPLLVFGYGIACGFVLVGYCIRLSFLHLFEGEIIASLVFAIGVSAWVVFLIVERRFTLPTSAAFAWETIAGLIGFLAFYVVLVFAVQQDFYHIEVSFRHPGRLLAFGVIALCSLPLFVLLETFLRRIQGAFRGFARGAIASLAAAAVFYAALAVSLYLVANRLARFNETLFAAMGFCALVGSVYYYHRKSTLGGALFTSFVVAWLISVGFIYY